VIRAGDETRILSVISTLKYRLADFIDPDFGLLDELLRLGVLSRRQCAKVRTGDKTVYERNDALLDLLTSQDECVKFLKALQQTGQQHVVNFIMQNGGQRRNHIVTNTDPTDPIRRRRNLEIITTKRHVVQMTLLS